MATLSTMILSFSSGFSFFKLMFCSSLALRSMRLMLVGELIFFCLGGGFCWFSSFFKLSLSSQLRSSCFFSIFVGFFSSLFSFSFFSSSFFSSSFFSSFFFFFFCCLCLFLFSFPSCSSLSLCLQWFFSSYSRCSSFLCMWLSSKKSQINSQQKIL